MKVDIYKIHHKKWRYIIIPEGENIDAIVKSLSGFYPENFPTYRIIQRGHDTLSSSSALNSNVFRTAINQNGYKFSHKIRY